MPDGRRSPPARASFKEILAAGRDALWGLGYPFHYLRGNLQRGLHAHGIGRRRRGVCDVRDPFCVPRTVFRGYLEHQPGFGDDHRPRADHGFSGDAISWLLTVQGVTSAIVEPVIAMNPPPWAVLGFANLTMLVAGMFVDVFSNILILSPLLLRLMEPAGISELHFGIVATVNSDMGNITPPFGLNLFVASGAFKKAMWKWCGQSFPGWPSPS